MKGYIEFAAAKAWLKSQGFSRQDIECVLDLTSVRANDGVEYCHKDHLKRLAARAYWSGYKEIRQPENHPSL